MNTNAWTSALVEALSTSSDESTLEAGTWELHIQEQEAVPELPDGLPPADQDGNYDMPALNKLREVFQEFEQGLLSEDGVLDVLQRIADFTAVQLEEMDDCEAGTDLNDPGRRAIRSGFACQLEAVCHIALDIYDLGRVHDGLAAVQRATNGMVEGYRMVLEQDRKYQSRYCPMCGAENPRGAEKCSSCLQSFPDLARPDDVGRSLAFADAGLDDTPGANPTTPNFIAISQAVEGWRGGRLEDDQLALELERIRKRHGNHLLANQADAEVADDLPSEVRQSYLSLLEEIDHAASANIAAIDRMRLYFEDGDENHLEEGLSELAEATDLMLQSYESSQGLLQPTG